MMARRLLFTAPLAGVVGGAGAFYAYMGLKRDPRGVPSVLIGRAPPEFDLPVLADQAARLTPAALPRGRPVIVNFFASWCPPCRIEHPQMMRLSREGVAMIGIAFKDRPEDTQRFLGELGDPFRTVGLDQSGRTAIEWGVYGVPESYFVDPAGIVRWRDAHAITPELLEAELRPLLRRYRA